jgi:hypothetical protein
MFFKCRNKGFLKKKFQMHLHVTIWSHKCGSRLYLHHIVLLTLKHGHQRHLASTLCSALPATVQLLPRSFTSASVYGLDPAVARLAPLPLALLVPGQGLGCGAGFLGECPILPLPPPCRICLATQDLVPPRPTSLYSIFCKVIWCRCTTGRSLNL